MFKKLIDKHLDELIDKFFDNVKDTNSTTLAQQTATEGTQEDFKECFLTEIINYYCGDLNNFKEMFSQELLKQKFDTYYSQHVSPGLSEYEQNLYRNELYERYVLFCQEYLGTYLKDFSMDTKLILTNEKYIINKQTEQSIQLTQIAALTAEQTKMLTDLFEDKNNPIFEIKNTTANIRRYHNKYVAYRNNFRFDTHIDEKKEENNVLITNFFIKNIGQKVITDMSISNLRVYYCKDTLDDYPENGFLIMTAVEYPQQITCNLHLMPGGEQKIFLETSFSPVEINGEEQAEYFWEGRGSNYYNYDRLYYCFDVMLHNQYNDAFYTVHIFMSRDGEYSEEIGTYEIDHVIYIPKK